MAARRGWTFPDRAHAADDASCAPRVRELRGLVAKSPDVQTALAMWWETARRCARTPRGGAGRDGEFLLPRDDFLHLLRRLYRALYEVWDSEDADVLAAEEWERTSARTSGGEGAISEASFEESLIALTEAWAVGNAADSHAAFLYDLFRHVATGPEGVWRREEQVRFAGYRLGQYSSSWGKVDANNGFATAAPACTLTVTLPRKPISDRLAPSSAPPRRTDLGATAWRRMARRGDRT